MEKYGVEIDPKHEKVGTAVCPECKEPLQPTVPPTCRTCGVADLQQRGEPHAESTRKPRR